MDFGLGAGGVHARERASGTLPSPLLLACLFGRSYCPMIVSVGKTYCPLFAECVDCGLVGVFDACVLSLLVSVAPVPL